MSIQNRHALKAAAGEALAAAPGHQKLVLISAGAAAALSLAVSALNFILQGQIAGTGGLGGLGLRSVLSTVQSLLSLAMTLVLPFWSLGYVSAVLKLSRGEGASPDTLLDGFRRLGPALRLLLLTEVLYIVLGVVCVNAGSVLFSLTPLVRPLYDLMLPMLTDPNALEALDTGALLEAAAPMLIGCLVLFAAVAIPLSYRLRMARLRLMDDPGAGAFAALRSSSRMMKGSCLQLLRLDLSFWWFYLAEAAVMVLGYGDVLIPALGISLPMASDAAYFLFYVLGLLAQLGLYLFARNRVEVTYAKAYDALLQSGI